MKFGKTVKFTMSDDLLEEHNIADDVRKLSELIDLIQDKSDRICVFDLLSNIKGSMGARKA